MTDTLKYNVLTGAGLDQLTQQALKDNGVMALLNVLSLNNRNVAKSIGADCTYGGASGKVAILYFEGNNETQLYYADFGGKVKVGAGVIQTVNGNKNIEVYDVSNEKVYHTSTLTVVNGKPQTTWRNGPFVPSNKAAAPQVTVSPSYSSDCNECLYICNLLMEYGGCSVGTFFICTIACEPEGTIFCPLACAVVVGALCAFGISSGCLNTCTEGGMCP
jgi:hypothetical protein